MTTTTTTDRDARGYMLTTADDLRKVLNALNCWGDRVHPLIATQGDDNTVYGPVNRGLKALVKILYPDDGIDGRWEQILDVMTDDSDVSITKAAKVVEDRNAPLYGIATADIQADLARYRAYLTTFYDGMLDVDRLIGQAREGLPAKNHDAAAEQYLAERIHECVTALKWRNEPEVARVVRAGEES